MASAAAALARIQARQSYWSVPLEWPSQPVFIIGGGTSVASQPIELLKGRKVIVINSSYELVPWADALFFADTNWWMQHHRKLDSFAGKIVTTTTGVNSPRFLKLRNSYNGAARAQRQPIAFSDDPSAVAMRRTSFAPATVFAHHCNGGAPIVWLGADGKLGEDGKSHHRAPHKGWQFKPDRWPQHYDDLKVIADGLRERGVELINASPGSAWEDLAPVMDLPSAIAHVDAIASKVTVLMPKWRGGNAVRKEESSWSSPQSAKPPLIVTGMLGIGDCIHGRAVVCALMQTHQVCLRSYYKAIWHDLVKDGLRIIPMPRQAARIKEWDKTPIANVRLPRAPEKKIGYTPDTIKHEGSILKAQYASVGLVMPEQPDFSLSVLPAWRDAARKLIGDTRGKPVLVYRPIVLNRKWHCPPRAPEPEGYLALFDLIRDLFFIVSVADLTQQEWIVGKETKADKQFHHGELAFEELAGLTAEAKLVFTTPGVMSVLAQAVGTPNVCVYGGNESFRTTNSVGAHLAPTLAIEPDQVCECHDKTCGNGCSKQITIAPAMEKLMSFVEMALSPFPPVGAVGVGARELASPPSPQIVTESRRVLIFATIYVDTPERLQLSKQWLNLHTLLNPDCDFLIVDSKSPLLPPQKCLTAPRFEYFSFEDNIGHLSRNGPNGPSSKGQDGWGRAFCYGLQAAIDGGYDAAVHIEGDSLFRCPVMPIVQQMAREGIKVASTPVEGTRKKEVGWVETGLMFFSVQYLREQKFIERYDWPSRKNYPKTPERVIFDLLGADLRMLPLRAERGDKSQITVDNVTALDWVTHCHSEPAIYDRFVAAALASLPPAMEGAGPVVTPRPVPAPELVKFNFGCGTNRLAGWKNFDTDVDIAKRLPFPDKSADCIFAEHCVEHIDYYAALKFFAECARVLKPGGCIRIAVPSLEQIWRQADAEYCSFVAGRKWAPTADVRGALHAILHCHGHKAAWTESLLMASLAYAGFKNLQAHVPGQSLRFDLKGLEGHHKVIGEKFNAIETVAVEGEIE